MRDPITKLVLCWCWVVVRRVRDEVVNAAAFSDYAGKLLASKNPDGVFLFWCLVLIQLVVECDKMEGKLSAGFSENHEEGGRNALEYSWFPR